MKPWSLQRPLHDETVWLLDRDTYSCAKIRTKYPTEMSVVAKRWQRGEILFRQCGNIVAVAWKDNKVVNVVSTLPVLATQQQWIEHRRMGQDEQYFVREVWHYTMSIWGVSITAISCEGRTMSTWNVRKITFWLFTGRGCNYFIGGTTFAPTGQWTTKRFECFWQNS